jgi:hypothetical protein
MCFLKLLNLTTIKIILKILNLHILVVQRASLWHLHMSLQCFLIRFTPSIIFPHLPFTLYKNNFSMFHCSIFTHIYKVHQPCSLSFTLSVYHVPPTDTLPQLGPVYFSCTSFLSVYWLFKGISPWYFTHVYIAL